MPDNETVSTRRKAATVVVSLGAEQASQVYRYLREDEIEMLTLEVAGLEKVSPDQVEEILNEFYELCLAQKYITEGGLDYAKDVLEKAFGSQNASALIDKVTKSLRTRAFEFLRKADPKYVLTFLQNEHPQTIALILSYARPEQASAILAELPKEKQSDVAERIAIMERTSPDIVKEVEQSLEKRFASVMSTDYAEIGGIKHIAEIMNMVDRNTEKNILDELNRKTPAIAEEIRKRMFVFEDITLLDDPAIQSVLRETDTKDIMIALKGSNAEVSDIIYKNMSKRMGEQIREDMQYLQGVRFKDVEEAQQRIVAVIRRLEENGDIVISRGGKDELIV